MRRTALAATLLLAVAGTSFAGSTYQDLRHDHPSVGAAVSRMPSGFSGTLNRISSLLEQRRVEEIPPGGYASLPSGFDRQLSDALQRLQADLQLGLPALSLDDRLVIAQVVNILAIERAAELYSGIIPVPCPPGETCAPAISNVQLLQEIVDLLADSIRQGIAETAAATGLDLSSAAAAASAPVTPATFGTWLQNVVEACSALGVEHIDS